LSPPFDEFLFVALGDVYFHLLISWLVPFTSIVMCGAGHALCGDFFLLINHQVLLALMMFISSSF
jgi:hypothetical protein